MKDITIQVPDMQSAHCQARVNDAVKEVAGVKVQNLQAGQITVSLSSDSNKEAVVAAIEEAGYSVPLKHEL
ncbi:heavy-metal-associated domain-containing protein [Niabella yanshanensis]|uniref:Heavy-metal-associated domain-containing protein n=1 Tax=Niabella yanshanensis TaxID=577386 RepID=A0ABZ0W1K0_9BACT|nr:heavy-metal-associated domain-containing protein [Niabella yanshanensis]WQD36789.1 heavy-metal-associated domain-containing protein [Niabella yanshanensis]